MARTDTLTNYLTDVASAIKTKKGDNTPIQASSFDTEIANLPSGGDVSEYFNTIMDSSTLATFAINIVKKFPKLTIADGVTSLTSAFGNTPYKNMSFEGIDCSNITSMENMFYQNTQLQTIDLENIINTSNITDISYSFYNDTNLETISNMFPLIGNVNCRNAFVNCYNIKKLDLSNWVITANANHMFSATQSLAVLDISNITFSSTNAYTFRNCGTQCLQSDGAYADGIPYIYVKDAIAQSTIISARTDWSTNNVIVKSNQ